MLDDSIPCNFPIRICLQSHDLALDSNPSFRCSMPWPCISWTIGNLQDPYSTLSYVLQKFYRSSTDQNAFKVYSHTPVACWCVLPAFPISKGYLTAGISLGSLVDLKESSESQLFLRLVVSVLLTYVKWSCDEPIWAESEPVAGPCVFQEKHHHRQSPRGFAVPSLQAATWQDLPGYMRLL